MTAISTTEIRSTSAASRQAISLVSELSSDPTSSFPRTSSRSATRSRPTLPRQRRGSHATPLLQEASRDAAKPGNIETAVEDKTVLLEGTVTEVNKGGINFQLVKGVRACSCPLRRERHARDSTSGQMVAGQAPRDRGQLCPPRRRLHQVRAERGASGRSGRHLKASRSAAP